MEFLLQLVVSGLLLAIRQQIFANALPEKFASLVCYRWWNL